MGMPGEVKGVVRRSGVIGNFGGVHKRNAEPFGRFVQGVKCAGCEEAVYVVKPGHDNPLGPPLKDGRVVEQNLETELLKRIGHIGRIMVSENRQTAIIYPDTFEK